MNKDESMTHEESQELTLEVAKLRIEMRHVQETMASLVSRMEFAPVKLISYGLVGMVCSAVLAALIALVVKSGAN